MENIALEEMEWSVGRFGDRRLDKDPMRVDGSLSW